MILTPEQIRVWFLANKDNRAVQTAKTFFDAYADIVERVAEMDPVVDDDGAGGNFCYYCNVLFPKKNGHDPDCIYIAARKLRGKE